MCDEVLMKVCVLVERNILESAGWRNESFTDLLLVGTISLHRDDESEFVAVSTFLLSPGVLIFTFFICKREWSLVLFGGSRN